MENNQYLRATSNLSAIANDSIANYDQNNSSTSSCHDTNILYQNLIIPTFGVAGILGVAGGFIYGAIKVSLEEDPANWDIAERLFYGSVTGAIYGGTASLFTLGCEALALSLYGCDQ